MNVYVLEREDELPRPLAEVFEFFSDPGNLERLTPAPTSRGSSGFGGRP
jgi:ligand-binding SRPBCC domain-containing protein